MSRSPVPAVSTATKYKVALHAQAICQYWFDESTRCARQLWEFSNKRLVRTNNLSAVAHIYSPMHNGPRRMRQGDGIDDLNREWNLILLCLQHHKEVDDNWEDYPPELLFDWKRRRSPVMGLVHPDEIQNLLIDDQGFVVG